MHADILQGDMFQPKVFLRPPWRFLIVKSMTVTAFEVGPDIT